MRTFFILWLINPKNFCETIKTTKKLPTRLKRNIFCKLFWNQGQNQCLPDIFCVTVLESILLVEKFQNNFLSEIRSLFPECVSWNTWHQPLIIIIYNLLYQNKLTLRVKIMARFPTNGVAVLKCFFIRNQIWGLWLCACAFDQSNATEGKGKYSWRNEESPC